MSDRSVLSVTLQLDMLERFLGFVACSVMVGATIPGPWVEQETEVLVGSISVDYMRMYGRHFPPLVCKLLDMFRRRERTWTGFEFEHSHSPELPRRELIMRFGYRRVDGEYSYHMEGNREVREDAPFCLIFRPSTRSDVEWEEGLTDEEDGQASGGGCFIRNKEEADGVRS
jgi:hypothetical protein